MTHNALSAARTPFIRLLVPLLAGIIVQHLLHLPVWAGVLPAVGGTSLWAWFVRRDSIEEQYRKRPLFGWGLFFIVFALGLFLHAIQHRTPRIPDGFYPVAIAHIDQKAAEKSNSYYCPATITALADTGGHTVAYRERVALYFEKGLQARRLGYGDQVIFEFRLRPIESTGNPGDFDFAAFMRHKGITQSQYLPDAKWKKTGHAPHSGLLDRAASAQRKLSQRIDACGLSPHSAMLLKALLLGDRQQFPDEMRQHFSASGLSHILAVSGLHMGVVASLLYLLLFPLTLTEAGRRLRPLLTLLALWVYAGVTGLSPSAVRACIMASFLLTARVLERRNSSLNALFAAAFFMLLYDTGLAFDVGFQMSFAAVATILLFYRRLNVGGSSPYRLVRWASSCMAVSIAAQIGALPVAVYYFHTLPLLFLAGNLVVLPLLPVIFGLGLLLLFLASLQLPCGWIATATDLLLRFIEWFSLGIEQLPGSHIEGVWLAPRYLWLYFAGGILGYVAVKNRSKKVLWLTLGFGIAFGVVDLATYRPPRPEIVVYADNSSTVVQLSDREGCCLLCPDTIAPSPPVAGEMYRQQQGYDSYELFRPGTAPAEREALFIDYPFALFHGRRLLLLDSREWGRLSPGKRLKIDCVIVDRQFRGRLADVARLFDPGQVVIGANVHPARARLWLNDCFERGIPCHDIRSQGAWLDRP